MARRFDWENKPGNKIIRQGVTRYERITFQREAKQLARRLKNGTQTKGLPVRVYTAEERAEWARLNGYATGSTPDDPSEAGED
jgi:hypothetical protein